jgi:hypothetical protein
MLIPLLNVEMFFFKLGGGENYIWQVSYFVKTGPDKYHKIMILAQHWWTHVEACNKKMGFLVILVYVWFPRFRTFWEFVGPCLWIITFDPTFGSFTLLEPVSH